MRPQFNISLDEYPELPEKIRKLCKVRGYKISEFCARVLSDAIEKEISELSNTETLEDRVKRIESELVELRSRLGERPDSKKISEFIELLDTHKQMPAKIKNQISKILGQLLHR